MTIAAASNDQGSVPRVRVRRRARTIDMQIFGARLLFAIVLLGGAVAVAVVPWPNRAVMYPLVLTIDLAAYFMYVLYARDRMLPVFELGTLWVAAAFFYSAYPLFNFVAGGFTWSDLSDFRLRLYANDPLILGPFAWRYVLYFVSFIAVYLPVRGRAVAKSTVIHSPGKSRIASLIVLLAGIFLLLIAIGRYYGIEFDGTYKDIVSGETKTMVVLPYLVLQWVHTIFSIRYLYTQFLVGVMILNWRKVWVRLLLIGSFAIYGVYTTLNRGARSELFLLIMVAIMLYHRFVRPLTLRTLLPFGAMFLGSFFVLGIVRDLQGLDTLSTRNVSFFATANEFSAVYGTSFHVLVLKNDGTISHVPWQLKWGLADLYFIVPQQFLPFEKIDPSKWYLIMAGFENVGFMYGAVSEAILNGDWIELAIRGMLLGWLSALVHRWYVRRSDRFWPCMFYMFLCIWMYNSMRQTGFAVLYCIVYWFIPGVVLIEALAWMLRRTKQHARGLVKA